MQAWLDARPAGRTAEQAKLLWAPSGTRYQAFKARPIKDDFDGSPASSPTPSACRRPTPFIREKNRSTASEDQDRGL
jgi:hypothetical protein